MRPSPAEPQSARPPRPATEIRDWLVAEVARATNVGPADVDPAAPLASHGVDSLGAIGMTGGFAAWLGQDVPATLMWDYATIDAIAAGFATDAAGPGTAPRGVVEFQPHGDKPPLFCFPGIGGHPVTFAAFAGHLGPTQPCFGLAVPGLDGESAPLASVEEIAAAMVDSIRRVRPRGPYQLAGYSFGGLLAYEAARQLTACGERVITLALYDTFTPAGRVVRPRWQRAAVHAYLLATRTGRWAYVRDRLRGRQAARPADDEATEAAASTRDPSAAHLQAVVAANRGAAMRYRPGPYAGSACFFHAGVRPAYHRFYRIDRAGGWGALCAGGVRVIGLPGTHLTLLDAPDAKRAVDALRPFLA